ERKEREAAAAAKKAAEEKEKAAAALAAAAAASTAPLTASPVKASASAQPPSQPAQRGNQRASGSSQGKKGQPQKQQSIPAPVVAPTPSGPPTILTRAPPTPSAIPIQTAQQQRLPLTPGSVAAPIGRRATAPSLSIGMQSQPPQPGPSSGVLPPLGAPFQGPLTGGLYGPPSPANMSFGNPGPSMPFGGPQPPQTGPSVLQPSAVPRGFGQQGILPPVGNSMDFVTNSTPFPTGPPPPIGPSSSSRVSPGPNLSQAQMMSPGGVGTIGSGFSPGPRTAHSRRSSIDPIGSRNPPVPPPGFGAITRPIAPIGTKPLGVIGPASGSASTASSLAPGTPVTINGQLFGGSSMLDGEEVKGSPVRRTEATERLGSSALVDPTDEPIPLSGPRRGTGFWGGSDLTKSPIGSSGPSWSAFAPGPLPIQPTSGPSPWSLPTPSSAAPGSGWPTASAAPGSGRGAGFSPIGIPPGAIGSLSSGGPGPIGPPSSNVGGPGTIGPPPGMGGGLGAIGTPFLGGSVVGPFGNPNPFGGPAFGAIGSGLMGASGGA
ncbi:hypothetical protein FRB90_010238, partial [Tulasnella sp. 427]